MKEKNKNKTISLINDMRKGIATNDKKETIRDERVIKETNKIMAVAFNILVFVMVLTSITFGIIHIDSREYSSVIFSAIGIISYVSLIIMCKKNIIENNEYVISFFIWGIITMPISLYNILSDFIYRNIYDNKELMTFYLVISIIGVIIFGFILYEIANKIYKNANKNL